MHIQPLKESFLYLKKNPLLYLPDLVMTAILSVLLYFIYVYTGIADFLVVLQSVETVSLELFTSYLSENLKELIVSGLTFFFFSFIFGVGVIIFKFVMIKQILSGKKVSLSSVWKEKGGFFWSIVFLRILVYVLSLIVIALVALIGLVLYFLFFSLHENLAIILSLGIAIPLALILFIGIKLALLFRYPVMFLTHIKKPIPILKESYSLLKKSPQFVLKTWLVVLLLTLIFWAGSSILDTFVSLGISFLPATTVTLVLSSIWSLVGTLLSITIDLWTSIYVFLQFKRREIK